MRQSCAHEHSEFEFLSALVTVRCRGFVGSVSHLCQLLTLNCYHSRPDYPRPDYPILGLTCLCLANWQPCLPSVCCQMPSSERGFVAIGYNFLSFLLNPFFDGWWFNPWGQPRAWGAASSPLLTWASLLGPFVDDRLRWSEVSALERRLWCHPAKMYATPLPPFLSSAWAMCESVRRHEGRAFLQFAGFFSSDKASTGNVSVGWLALCCLAASSQRDRRHARRIPHGRGWGPTSLIIPLMARLTSSSPLSSFPLTPIYSTTSLFPKRGTIAPNVHFHFSSPEFYFLSSIHLPLLLLLLPCAYLPCTVAFRKINKCGEARAWLITF